MTGSKFSRGADIDDGQGLTTLHEIHCLLGGNFLIGCSSACRCLCLPAIEGNKQDHNKYDKQNDIYLTHLLGSPMLKMAKSRQYVNREAAKKPEERSSG